MRSFEFARKIEEGKVVAEKAFKVLSWKYYKGLTLEQQK